MELQRLQSFCFRVSTDAGQLHRHRPLNASECGVNFERFYTARGFALRVRAGSPAVRCVISPFVARISSAEPESLELATCSL
jgi:hypothetical protein